MQEEMVIGEPSLRLLRAGDGDGGAPPRGRPVVLFVHGTTFPAPLASGYRFDDGSSWLDVMGAAGIDAWALDFAGYGGSDRYPEMAQPPQSAAPLGRVPVAADQISRAVDHVCESTGAAKLSMLAHSWGTLAAGRYAGTHPARIERLVLFGPITRRELLTDLPSSPAFKDVTLEEQYGRFVEDPPEGHPPVLEDFGRWGRDYLATDSAAATRDPAAVRIPGGPMADIMSCWAGYFAYDPASIRAPVLVVRGEWDSLCTDSDADWLTARLTSAAEVHDVVIARATHLMHLETGRHDLYAATLDFLSR
ncbi:MAG: alpha/beta hydrolase [Solirubrobacteraceae bacterium]